VTLTAADPDAARAEALAAAPRAVEVEGIAKSFTLPHQRYTTLKERVLAIGRPRTHDELHVLDGMSFDVARGEFFGIVGRNGSGKSTLLKCLAGIYDLDGGSIRIDGRLSPFIELGVGFNPDLTARDNVLINAIMLGLSRKEAQARFDEIIEFAELQDFIDLKLKNYSSGMSVRLGFSVAIQVDAEILLVDEVLAVGDAAFQQKCFEQFFRMKEEGRTILFVTHDMGSVERFCDRAMLIERGQIVECGEPSVIARKYNELNFGQLAPAGAATAGEHHGAEILGAWFEDAAGERVVALAQGEPCRACFEVRFEEGVEDPIFAAALRNDARHTIFVASTEWSERHTGAFAAGEQATVRIEWDNWLAPSRYSMTPWVARAGTGADKLGLREDLASLMVHGTHVSGGVADLPHSFDVARG
jgi:ABC-type polysaccharide/polyol phosphate transport system ATPase subunit